MSGAPPVPRQNLICSSGGFAPLVAVVQAADTLSTITWSSNSRRQVPQAVGREELWTTAAMREGGQLVPQGEIVEDEGLSRACQGAHGPDEKLEEQQHCRRMRGNLCDCNGSERFWVQARRTEYWRGAGESGAGSGTAATEATWK
jgi:hypothetical protein